MAFPSAPRNCCHRLLAENQVGGVAGRTSLAAYCASPVTNFDIDGGDFAPCSAADRADGSHADGCCVGGGRADVDVGRADGGRVEAAGGRADGDRFDGDHL